MALGSMTVQAKSGQQASSPTFADVISFAGDGAYPTGGTASFKSLVQSALGDGRTPLAVLGQDCGGYTPVYDLAADKLKVYKSDGNAGPLVEVANAADLSAVTFNVVVVSQ